MEQKIEDEIKEDIKILRRGTLFFLLFTIVSLLWILFLYIIPSNFYTIDSFFHKGEYQKCTAQIIEKNIKKKWFIYIKVRGIYDGKKFEGCIAQRLFDRVGEQVEIVKNGDKIGRKNIVILLKSDRDYYTSYIDTMFLLLFFLMGFCSYRYNMFLLKGEYSTTFCKVEHIKYRVTPVGKKMMFKASGKFKDGRGKYYKCKSGWHVGVVDLDKDLFVGVQYSKRNPKKHYTFLFDEAPISSDELLSNYNNSDV